MDIFQFWLLRWRLKVQHNLPHTIRNQRQSLGKTWEEQTKAAFACCEHEAPRNESSADVYAAPGSHPPLYGSYQT